MVRLGDSGEPAVAIALVAALAVIAGGCGDKKHASAPSKAAPNKATPNKGTTSKATPGEAAPTANAADKGKGPAEAGGKPAAKPAPAGKPAAKLGKHEPSLLPDISEAQVTHLLETWVKAQNEGDYEAYAHLYAERFYGTKRSGARSRSFRRKAWLRDRKRMFGKQMAVEAKDPEILTTAGTAMVQFEQSWASGRYKDIGPKQLVIVRERGELRIAREEMLRSVVDKGGPKAKAIDPRDFGFVLQDGGAWMVLDTRPKPEWADSKRLTLLQSGGYASVTSPVRRDKLPEALAGWQGRTVQLYGSKGPACRGQVVGLAVMARVKPHFGTVQYWRGELDAKPGGAAIAREAWRLGDTGRLLVGRVLPLAGNDCRSAIWGRDAEREAPKLAPPTAIQPAIASRAIAALRKLKAWKALQKAYAEEVPMPRALEWDRYKGAAPSVGFIGTPDGSRRYVSVAVSAGDGCGDFSGELWALWRVVGEGPTARLQLLTDDTAPGRLFRPQAAADLDGDGKLEFIGVDALLQPAGPILREGLSVEVPSLDCPC